MNPVNTVGTDDERTASKIPEFASREEEAAFWDAHDTTDFEEEMQPARVRFSKKLSRGITIRLDEETLASLRAHAQRKGIGPTTLIRMWVLDRLREEA